MSRRGFGYAIDYAKAIAEDEAQIAYLSSAAAICIAAELAVEEQDHPGYQWPDAIALLFARPDRIAARAAILGLDADDLRAVGWFAEVDALADVEPQKGDYQRGLAIWTRWGEVRLYTETERRAALKKARTSLARHKRNGGAS